MNWLQKLLGIDRIVDALKTNKPSSDNNLVMSLQQQLDAALLREKQEQAAKEQLQQALSTQAKPDDRSAALIAQLQQEVAKLKATNDPKQALQAYFAPLMANNTTEEKKGVGRPKINSKKYNMSVDLDLSILVEHLAAARQETVTRQINDIIRDWMTVNHPALMDALATPRDLKIISL